jgi:hypothetical protein
VPAIGYLLGGGSALLGSFGIIASPIPADNLHAWMGDQPLEQRFGFPIRQQVYWHPFFQIDEDCAVGAAAAKGLGKGNGVTAIPSPKNRAGMFPCTRLKPFMTPV